MALVLQNMHRPATKMLLVHNLIGFFQLGTFWFLDAEELETSGLNQRQRTFLILGAFCFIRIETDRKLVGIMESDQNGLRRVMEVRTGRRKQYHAVEIILESEF